MNLAQRISEVSQTSMNTAIVPPPRFEGRRVYPGGAASVDGGDVEEALEQDPNLAELWLERGMDQRLGRRWGIERVHGQYRIQRYASGRHLLEKDRLHACAEFIVRYVGFIGEVVRRYQH